LVGYYYFFIIFFSPFFAAAQKFLPSAVCIEFMRVFLKREKLRPHSGGCGKLEIGPMLMPTSFKNTT
jgi:hypothetical protein